MIDVRTTVKSILEGDELARERWKKIEPHLERLETLLPELIAWLVDQQAAAFDGRTVRPIPAHLGQEIVRIASALGGFTPRRPAPAGE